MPVVTTSELDFEPSAPMWAVALADAVYEVPLNLLVMNNKTNAIVVQAQDENVYFTVDGTDPDPSADPPVGFIIYAAPSPEVRIKITNIRDGKRPKFYRATAGTILQIQPARDIQRPV